MAAVAADHAVLGSRRRVLPEHVHVCPTARVRPWAHFVQTGVALSDLSAGGRRGSRSLTQNLCVARGVIPSSAASTVGRRRAYGCDDLLYNRTPRACCRGVDLDPRPSVFHRRRQFVRPAYDRKFSRPALLSEVTLDPARQAVRLACSRGTGATCKRSRPVWRPGRARHQARHRTATRAIGFTRSW